MDNTLSCVCGKVFTVIKSLSAHESQCKVHKECVDQMYPRHEEFVERLGHRRRKKKQKRHRSRRDSSPEGPEHAGAVPSLQRAPSAEVPAALSSPDHPIIDLPSPRSPGLETPRSDHNQVPMEVRRPISLHRQKLNLSF
jgi:hypothetical protein